MERKEIPRRESVPPGKGESRIIHWRLPDPLFAEGLILEDGDSTTYTLFAGDQKSGAYFVPYVEKAAREMK